MARCAKTNCRNCTRISSGRRFIGSTKGYHRVFSCATTRKGLSCSTGKLHITTHQVGVRCSTARQGLRLFDGKLRMSHHQQMTCTALGDRVRLVYLQRLLRVENLQTASSQSSRKRCICNIDVVRTVVTKVRCTQCRNTCPCIDGLSTARESKATASITRWCHNLHIDLAREWIGTTNQDRTTYGIRLEVFSVVSFLDT